MVASFGERGGPGEGEGADLNDPKTASSPDPGLRGRGDGRDGRSRKPPGPWFQQLTREQRHFQTGNAGPEGGWSFGGQLGRKALATLHLKASTSIRVIMDE